MDLRAACARRLAPPLLAVLLCMGPGLFSTAGAQDDVLPEIPMTLRSPVAARYAGMGGASLAVADDHSACLSNPATLGLVRSIEFAAGFTKQDGETDVDYLGTPSSVDFGKTRLSHLGFAYPFPTYRGRFVVGFQYGRVSSFDSDYIRRASTEGFFENESIYEEGGMTEYGLSGALQVSPTLTLGATGVIVGGGSFREHRYRYQDTEGSANSTQTTDVDLSAVSASFGALIEVAPSVRLGLLVDLPRYLDLDGSVLDRSEEGTDEFTITDEINLPARLGAGVAVALPSVVLAADAIYADWSQIDYFGPVRASDGRNAYRETLELHVGAEYLLALPTPIRVRAGYLLQPLAYQLLLTDSPTYEDATFDSDRKYLTVGAGLLIGKTVTLDLAYMFGGYERSAIQQSDPELYREDVTDRRLLASVSLRLN
jgi:long-subunit fatty acid transport protein